MLGSTSPDGTESGDPGDHGARDALDDDQYVQQRLEAAAASLRLRGWSAATAMASALETEPVERSKSLDACSPLSQDRTGEDADSAAAA